MQFNRTEILEALTKCMPGISTGQVTLEGADSFVFNDGYVHTYNSAISVSVKLANPFINGIVNAGDFYNALQKFPMDDCNIEAGNNDSWIITCGKIKVTVKLLQTDNIMDRFTNIVPDEGAWIDIDGQEMQDAIKFCHMPSNGTKFSGVIFKDNYLLSTDGWQVNRFDIKKGTLPFVWINNDTVKVLSTWNSFTKLQYNKTWLQFTNSDNVVFSVKTLFTDSFPLDNVLGSITMTENMNLLTTGSFTKEFFSAVDRASGFSQKEDSYSVVDLHFTPNGIIISSNKASGSYEETIEDIKCDVDVTTHIDASMLIGTKDVFESFIIFKGAEIPGKETPLRFEFKNEGKLSIVSSMN